jgi:hypothetical protein
MVAIIAAVPIALARTKPAALRRLASATTARSESIIPYSLAQIKIGKTSN